MNIAIVDDSPQEALALETLISEYSSLCGKNIEISRFESSEAFFGVYSPNRFTVIFLDIYMEGTDGIETCEMIRKTDSDVLVVFLTSSSEHMPEAFRLHAYDYIGKPATKERVFGLLDDILRRCTDIGRTLDFTYERADIRVPYSKIAVILANGHSIEMTDTDGKMYRPWMTFSSVCERLNEDKRFLVINRGVLVNMDLIVSFGGGVCNLSAGTNYPINVKNRKALEQTWQNYMFSKIRSESAGRRMKA